MRFDGDAIKNLYLFYGDIGKIMGLFYEFFNYMFIVFGC